MANVNDLICTIEQLEALAAAVVAQTCNDYFDNGRALHTSTYTDLNERNEDRNCTYKTLIARMDEYRDWFTNPNSDFNRIYKPMLTSSSGNSISLLNGNDIVAVLDNMIEDTDSFPEKTYNFVHKVHP